MRTTLANVFEEVPHLRSLCYASKTSKSRAVLKRLLLVSRSLRAAMLGTARNATIKITGDSDVLSIANFLKGCCLNSLTVVITAGNSLPGTPGWDHQRSQVLALITLMRAALKSVALLDLDICVDDCSVAIPFAAACPKLKHLVIRGRFNGDMLAAFGESCPGLDTLHMHTTADIGEWVEWQAHVGGRLAGSYRTDALEVLLPAVTQLSMIQLGVKTLSVHAMFLLLGCKNLISISAPHLDAVVQKFKWPCAHVLQKLELQTDLVGGWLGSVNLPQLHTLILHIKGQRGFSAEGLAGMLREYAPAVRNITLITHGRPTHPLSLSWLCADCRPESIATLVYLNERVRTGTNIQGGLNIVLSAGHPFLEPDNFFAACPVLGEISGLHLEDFTSRGWFELPHRLAEVFPNLTSFGSNVIAPWEFTRVEVLRKLTVLKRVALVLKRKYTPAQIHRYLSPLHSLRSLEMYFYSNPDLAATVPLQQEADLLRKALEHRVIVMVSADRKVTSRAGASALESDEDSDVEILHST